MITTNNLEFFLFCVCNYFLLILLAFSNYVVLLCTSVHQSVLKQPLYKHPPINEIHNKYIRKTTREDIRKVLIINDDGVEGMDWLN
jgi:hypothetical protein